MKGSVSFYKDGHNMATANTPKTIFGEIALNDDNTILRTATVITNENSYIAYLKKGDY